MAYNNSTYTSNVTTTTSYLGGQVFESKAYSNTTLQQLQYNYKLQFAAHEEGRIRTLYNNPATPNTPIPLFEMFAVRHL